MSVQPDEGETYGTYDDEALAALNELIHVLRSGTNLLDELARRAEFVTSARANGRDYRDIVLDEERPLMVELLSDRLSRVIEAGSRYRRAHARALYAEGLTMDQIASLFGVTRQRVSVLLREPPG